MIIDNIFPNNSLTGEIDLKKKFQVSRLMALMTVFKKSAFSDVNKYQFKTMFQYEIKQTALKDAAYDFFLSQHPNENPQRLFKIACSEDNDIALDFLLQNEGVNPIAGDIMWNAVYRGKNKVANRLIKDQRVYHSISINSLVVIETIEQGNLEMINILLKNDPENRIDFSIRNNELIKKAVECNQIQILKLLLKNEKVINSGCFDIKELITMANRNNKDDNMIEIINYLTEWKREFNL